MGDGNGDKAWCVKLEELRKEKTQLYRLRTQKTTKTRWREYMLHEDYRADQGKRRWKEGDWVHPSCRSLVQ